MSIDLRGFTYALEPLRRKHRWQLDALQAKLGVAQQEADQAQAVLDDLQNAYAHAADFAARAGTARFDPSLHQRSVAFLLQSRQRIDAQKEVLKKQEQQRDALRRDCTIQQQKLELTGQHRQRCMEEYRTMELNRESAQADRDWIARSQWRVKKEQGETA